jgi:D-3-phosphoglycerate dehydrogenase
MLMFRVLVTSKSFAKYSPELVEKMESFGIEIHRAQQSNMDSCRIAEIIGEYDGLICGIDKIDKHVIDCGAKLKLIHMNGTGVDHIDVDYATCKGIYVGNCPGANANAVAEYNLAILLAEARKVIRHANYISSGEWKRTPGIELSNKTIGVIGVGYIGKRFVELLKGFNMRVLVYDIQPDYEWAMEHGVEIAADMKQIFAESDFISLHVPLIGPTSNIINQEALSMMKKDVIIVNTARGGLIDTNALIDAIKYGRIRGAALDAFEEEPIPSTSDLLNMDITLTPHVAASTIETVKHVSSLIADNVINCLVYGNGSRMVNHKEIESNGEKARAEK